MKKVYICAPFTGDTKKNINVARRWSRTAYKLGYLPICMHIYLEGATGLNEDTGDRKELLRLGLEMLKLCDECWICTKKISKGMEEEIDNAGAFDIKIREIYKEIKKKNEKK